MIDTDTADRLQRIADMGQATAAELVALAEYNDRAIWESYNDTREEAFPDW